MQYKSKLTSLLITSLVISRQFQPSEAWNKDLTRDMYSSRFHILIQDFPRATLHYTTNIFISNNQSIHGLCAHIYASKVITDLQLMRVFSIHTYNGWCVLEVCCIQKSKRCSSFCRLLFNSFHTNSRLYIMTSIADNYNYEMPRLIKKLE